MLTSPILGINIYTDKHQASLRFLKLVLSAAQPQGFLINFLLKQRPISHGRLLLPRIHKKFLPKTAMQKAV